MSTNGLGGGELFQNYLLQNEKYLSNDSEKQNDKTLDTDEVQAFFSSAHIEVGEGSSEDGFITDEEFDAWWDSNTGKNGSNSTAILTYMDSIADQYGIVDVEGDGIEDDYKEFMRASMVSFVEELSENDTVKDKAQDNEEPMLPKSDVANGINMSEIETTALSNAVQKLQSANSEYNAAANGADPVQAEQSSKQIEQYSQYLASEVENAISNDSLTNLLSTKVPDGSNKETTLLNALNSTGVLNTITGTDENQETLGEQIYNGYINKYLSNENFQPNNCSIEVQRCLYDLGSYTSAFKEGIDLDYNQVFETMQDYLNNDSSLIAEFMNAYTVTSYTNSNLTNFFQTFCDIKGETEQENIAAKNKIYMMIINAYTDLESQSEN